MGEQMFLTKSEVDDWPSVVSILFKMLIEKFVKDCFTISDLSCKFLQISCTVPYTVIIVEASLS
jgi:hypothetical protein